MRKKLHFHFPEKPIPTAPQKQYVLRVDLFEGLELPQREFCIIHVLVGPYLVHSEPVKIENGRAIIYQGLPEKKVFLPVDPEEIPDIIVYFCDQN
jgi:hypothetical protein